MRRKMMTLLLLAGCLLSAQGFAQQSFNRCSAAFVGSKMVVNKYTTTGTCRLAASSTGALTVQTVELSPTQCKGVDKIYFKIAIRDKATGTLHLFSGESFRQVPVQNVLSSCKKGDHIVLLMPGTQYALPHNEILVL